MEHHILFGSYPIRRIGGIARHNFVAWVDRGGRPLFEINGGAANADGSFNYVALGGPLVAVVTDYTKRNPVYFPEYCMRPTSRMTLLIAGSYASIADRWRVATDVAEQVRKLNLRYSLLTQNSNSVATTVIKSMGLAPPREAVGYVRAPGSYRHLLPGCPQTL